MLAEGILQRRYNGAFWEFISLDEVPGLSGVHEDGIVLKLEEVARPAVDPASDRLVDKEICDELHLSVKDRPLRDALDQVQDVQTADAPVSVEVIEIKEQLILFQRLTLFKFA